VAQDVGPEFKPQYHKEKKKKNKPNRMYRDEEYTILKQSINYVTNCKRSMHLKTQK
jgi:hypothetical protein